jgi:hypothetical protein
MQKRTLKLNEMRFFTLHSAFCIQWCDGNGSVSLELAG